MPTPADKPWYDSKTGFLLLDEYVAEMPSFQKIMEDGVVTDEELAQQARLVTASLQKLEATLSPAAKAVATETLCELAVLHALQQYRKQAR